MTVKKKTKANNGKSGVEHSHTQSGSETFVEQFNKKDLFWLVVGIALFILLSYAVIHFDIVTIETFTNGMSKYNVSNAAANAGASGVLG